MDNKIHDLGNKANDMAREGARQMSNQTSKAADAISDQADSIGRKVSNLASSATEALKDYGLDTDSIQETARAKTSQLQDAFIAEIRTNPIRSVAIAAGIGFVMALFARN